MVAQAGRRVSVVERVFVRELIELIRGKKVDKALTDQGGIIEVQASAEDTPFSADEMAELTRLAMKGIRELCALQAAAVKG